MNNRFTRPEMLLWALVAVLCPYLSLPILFWDWLVSELEAGSFPVNGDSIGIPFAGFMFAWFVGLVVFGAVGIMLRLRCSESFGTKDAKLQEQKVASGVK